MKFPKTDGIKRNIWIFGIVSMLNDITSEAILPLLPVFVTNVLGAGPEILGLIEGIAKATNSLSRPIFGWLSDRLKKRKGFVGWGYTTSIFGRFLVAISFSWPVVLVGRFIDRLGKGMRTPARDAMIAEFSKKRVRGTAFGIHRALDTAGAVLGPLLALALLPMAPRVGTWIYNSTGIQLHELNVLFLLMLIPAIVTLPLLFFLVQETRFAPGKRFSPHLPPRLKKFLVVATLFGLANFPIAFVLLRAQEIGLNLSDTLIVYLIFNVVYMLIAYPTGRAIDKFGGKNVLALSYAMFGLASLGFIFVNGFLNFSLVLVVFAGFTAMYETATRAFTSLLVKSENLGKSYGFLDLSVGVASLLSGIIMGVIWSVFGSKLAFGAAAVIAVLASIAMIVIMD